MSPLRAVHHGNPYFLLAHWIATYATHDPTLICSDNATFRLNTDNDPQPDLCLLCVSGQTHFDDELLPISALQHLVFCECQCAIIRVERLWAENQLTGEGNLLHKKAHEASHETITHPFLTEKTTMGLLIHLR